MTNPNSPISAPYHYDIVDTHIDNIFTGCVIEHNGKHMTVCKNDIKTGGFMGSSIFGDSYNSGYKPVKKVIIKSK
jgi:hypothetical protein